MGGTWGGTGAHAVPKKTSVADACLPSTRPPESTPSASTRPLLYPTSTGGQSPGGSVGAGNHTLDASGVHTFARSGARCHGAMRLGACRRQGEATR